jgi:selenocysteine-specific elongation factor
MIIATAGHVDHGKTLLIRALTGVDTEKPEEKRRGMTIDLGFANRPVGDEGMLAFIDVPGHERFIRNMISGVSAIHFALIVIAADDGPMPQTLEHVAILDLLRIPRGAVVVTKTDLVAPARVKEVNAQMREVLKGTTLSDAPLFAVSAANGEGMNELLAHLENAEAQRQLTRPRGQFRLAVDRHFQLKGVGLIVAGSVQSGRVRVGDQCILTPLGAGGGLRVRIRSLEAQGRHGGEARMGERCAMNIVGAAGDAIPSEALRRGLWLTSPIAALPVQRVDIRLRLLESEDRPLSFWTPVHVHLGAADVMGRVALLEGRRLLPGHSALAQLVLDEPVIAARSDRVVLRDQSARRTLGGGSVLDPFGPIRGRARPERRAKLQAMESRNAVDALRMLLDASPDGVKLYRFERAFNFDEAEHKVLREAVAPVVVGAAEEQVAFSPNRWQAMTGAVHQILTGFHADYPQKLGMDVSLLHRQSKLKTTPEIFGALLRDMENKGVIARRGALVRLVEHQARPTQQEAVLWAKLQPLIAQGGRVPPRLRELADLLRQAPEALERFFDRAEALGLAVHITPNRVYLPSVLRELADVAETLAKGRANGRFDAAAYRDHAGISRNLSIEILEYFDRVGFTRRHGNERDVIGRAAEIFPAAENDAA